MEYDPAHRYSKLRFLRKKWIQLGSFLFTLNVQYEYFTVFSDTFERTLFLVLLHIKIKL